MRRPIDRVSIDAGTIFDSDSAAPSIELDRHAKMDSETARTYMGINVTSRLVL